jgi:glutamine synthetase
MMWCDIDGLAHGRYVPTRRADSVAHHAVTSLLTTFRRDIVELDGYSTDAGFPDMTASPLPESRRPGWEPDTDVVLASLSFGGEPLAICPRRALERVVDAWRALGYEPLIGYEIELYITASVSTSGAELDPSALGHASPSHRVYGTGSGGDRSGLMHAVFDAAENSDLDLEAVSAEYSPGQFEINLRFGPATEMADRVFLTRELCRDIAAERGVGVTFLGRPFAGEAGSGLHLNFSLRRIDDDTNAFDSPESEHGLSALTKHCIAGLIDHHEALTAWCAPLVNSYRRLQPGIISGYWANWGLDNRISTYRVPADRGEGTRIENRLLCGSSNPYLAAAATLAAALLGHRRELACPAPQVGNGDANPNTDRHTPHTLDDALDALDRDHSLAAEVGEDMTRAYLAMRRHDAALWAEQQHEWEPNSVSEWELATYLPYF